MKKKELRNLIITARVDEAIDKMLKYAQEGNKTDLYDELSVIKSQREKTIRDKRRGIITQEQETANFAKFSSTLIDLLKEFDDEEAPASPPPPVPTSPSNGGEEEQVEEEEEVQDIKILFLASNPSDSAYLQLDKEFKKVYQALQSEDNCRLFHEDAVTPSKLQDAIVTREPTIIHFSGHGMGEKKAGSEQGKRGSIVDVDIETARNGLVLQNEVTGKSQLVSTKALETMFKTITKDFSVEVVMLNACYSENQAKAILDYVPYVIGMTDAVADETAIELAKSFYKYLIVNGKSVEQAFELAQSHLLLNDMPGADIPRLLSKKQD